jgi:hypothetical protein
MHWWLHKKKKKKKNKKKMSHHDTGMPLVSVSPLALKDAEFRFMLGTYSH